MKAIAGALSAFAALMLSSVHAQTFSACNPLQRSDCPPDTALGTSINVDFSKGSSGYFKADGTPSRVSFSGDGAHLSVIGRGDSPQLTSNFYIMFGRIDVTVKVAPGRGIVSSIVLESDVLDEIDWEFLGGDPGQAQSNYFGKGYTGSYNRGQFHAVANNQATHTYSIDWNADRILWLLDGTQVRSLTPQEATNQYYPQTPMQVKIGIWAGGDSSNAQGTIDWAGGLTDYSAGPFTMLVESIRVQDYSTGTQYAYNGNSGAWTSIVSKGGQINSGGSSDNGGSSPPPAATTTAIGTTNVPTNPVALPTTLTTIYSASIPISTDINPCPEGKSCVSYNSPTNSGLILASSATLHSKPTTTGKQQNADTTETTSKPTTTSTSTSFSPSRTSTTTTANGGPSTTIDAVSVSQTANAAFSITSSSEHAYTSVLVALVVGLGVGFQALFV